MTTNTEFQKQLGANLSMVTENLRVAVQKIENYKKHQCLLQKRLESVTQENREITDRLQQAEQYGKLYRDEWNELRKEKFAREIKERSDLQTEQKLSRDYNDLKTLYEVKEKEWEQKMKDSERSFHEIIRNQKQKLDEYAEKMKKQVGKTNQEESKRQPGTTNDIPCRVPCDDTETRVIGHKLTDNNPNIADLSDRNRPTMLTERFGKLFDNQWYDAFEELQKSISSDEEIIEILLEIVMNIDDFCKRRAREQLDDLQSVLLCSKSAERTQASCPDNIVKQLKDCQKTTSSLSNRYVYEMYLSSCATSIGNLRYAVRTETRLFVQGCLEICWLMAVQNPPLVFGPIVTKGEKFNTNMYKAYRKRGDRVAFVVWPALLLHENGPILCKGIAQGIENERNKMAIPSSEQNKDVASKPVTMENDEGINLHKSYDAHVYASTDFMMGPRSQQTSSYNQIAIQTTDLNYTPAQFSPPSDSDVDRFFRYRDRYGRETARDMIGHQKYDDIRSYCIQNGFI